MSRGSDITCTVVIAAFLSIKMSQVRCVNFQGYEKIADKYGISAAVCVPAGARLMVTSGHVGMDDEMNVKVDLKEQMELAFKVCF